MAAFYGAKERENWYGVTYNPEKGFHNAVIMDPITRMIVGFNLPISAYDAAKIRKYALLLMPASISNRIYSDFVPDATDQEAINAIRDPSTITHAMFPYDLSEYVNAVQAATAGIAAANAAIAAVAAPAARPWSRYNTPENREWLREMNTTYVRGKKSRRRGRTRSSRK